MLRQMQKVKQPYNLNAFSQAAAATVLEHQDLFREQIRKILEQREVLQRGMEAIDGVTPYSSAAYYLLFLTNYASKIIYQGLLDRGVLIRRLGGPELPGYLRVSVGTPEQNKQFLSALTEVMELLGRE